MPTVVFCAIAVSDRFVINWISSDTNNAVSVWIIDCSVPSAMSEPHHK